MNLRVERHIFSDRSSIGKLFIDGEFQCFTLEPVWRTDGAKPRAIGEGTFPLKPRWSEKHMRTVPGVENVPGFTDVEIHPLNSWTETEACLGVGENIGPDQDDWISRSQEAFYDLMEILTLAWDSGQTVDITYVNKFSEAAG